MEPRSSIKKSKPPQNRVYDSDGFRKRVDCICFRDMTMKEVLLVSSRNNEGCWTVPGGGLEPGETASKTALREIAEEGGVECTIQSAVGVYEDSQHRTRTEVFIMTAEDERDQWLDRKECGRVRKWFQVDDALDVLRSRPNYPKFEPFQSACAAAQKISISSSSGSTSQSPSSITSSRDLSFTREHQQVLSVS